MKMSQQAKQLKSSYTGAFLSRNMKKKRDEIVKQVSKMDLADAPAAPHVSSTWIHKEFVPGKQTTVSFEVTFHRFLLSNMVTMKSLRKQWIDGKQLYIEIDYPEYFVNPVSTAKMLVDEKGNVAMAQDQVHMASGFEQDLSTRFGDDAKPCAKFLIKYEKEQVQNEWFILGPGRPGFYLQKGKTKNADGEDCPYKELHVVTKEYIEEEEDEYEEEMTPEAPEAPVFDSSCYWGNNVAPSDHVGHQNGGHGAPKPPPPPPVPHQSNTYPQAPSTLPTVPPSNGPNRFTPMSLPTVHEASPIAAPNAGGAHQNHYAHHVPQPPAPPAPPANGVSPQDLGQMFQMLTMITQQQNEMSNRFEGLNNHVAGLSSNFGNLQSKVAHVEREQHMSKNQQNQSQTQVDVLSAQVAQNKASRPHQKRIASDISDDRSASKRIRPSTIESENGEDEDMLSHFEGFEDASQEEEAPDLTGKVPNHVNVMQHQKNPPIASWRMNEQAEKVSVNSDEWEEKLPDVNVESCLQLCEDFENDINTAIEWFEGYTSGKNNL